MIKRLLFTLLHFAAILPAWNQNPKIDSLKTALKEATNTERIETLIELSDKFIQSNHDSALFYAYQALKESSGIDDPKRQAGSLKMLGDVFYANGQYDSSIVNYNAARELFNNKNDSSLFYDVQSGLANNYRQKGDFPKAISLLKKSVDFFERSGDKRKVAANCNYLGGVFYYFEDLERCTLYWERALSIYTEINFKSGISNMLNNLGVVYRKQGNYEKTLEFYYESLEMDREANNLYGQGLMLNNIGFTLNYIGNENSDPGKHEEALSNYQQAYAINSSINNSYSLIYTLYGLSETHLHLKDFAQSVKYAEEGLDLTEKSGSIYEFYDLYNLLTAAYDSLRIYDKAYAYSVKTRQFQDSIFSKERSQSTIEFEEKYEAEKKDNEIKLLNKEKEIQKLELKNKNNLVLGLTMGIMLFVGMGIFLVRVIMMRKDAFNQVAEKNNVLAEQNEEILAQRDQIEQQNVRLEEKNNLIFESIRYAQQIQETILPSYSTILNSFDEFFVFYRPKDIVSGDFYWVSDKGKLVVAAVDCTGHGIPGAFMSMIGNELLNEIILDRRMTNPSEILTELNNGIIRTLKQNIKHNFHGMDVALCVIDKAKGKLNFAGARNSLIMVRKGELTEFKGDRFSLGGLIQKNKSFTTREINLEADTAYYMFSDGLQHQFGGENDKKFSLKRIKSLIVENQHLPMKNQRETFEKAFEAWKGEGEQIDDVLLMGFKVV
jgi:serine phosphatase RsbU (regulator of sigma subunit)